MYKVIDIKNHKRKATFEFYNSFEDPFFNITSNIDVTGLYAFCRENKYSFSLAVLHVAMMAANDVAEFKQRMVDDQIIQYDVVHPGSTILKEDETFTFAYFNYQPDISVFLQAAKAEITLKKAIDKLEPEAMRKDLIYFTTIPWVSFTQFKHARSGKADTIPRIVFGKYFKQNDKLLMPVSVEVHHALVDGIHVGKFIEKLSKLLNKY